MKAVWLWTTLLLWLEGMVNKMKSLRDTGRREGTGKLKEKTFPK